MVDKDTPMHEIKRRRDGVLQAVIGSIPFVSFLGIEFVRYGDELTAVMKFSDKLIGSPIPPRLHGGTTSGLLEVCAIVELTWRTLWEGMEDGSLSLEALERGELPPMPKTIDFTVDFLNPGLTRDVYARARVNRTGRSYASVHVEAWQDKREILVAQATGHFLMPSP